MIFLAAVVLVQGTLELFTSPPPGEIFQGDGHAVVKVASDNVHIVNATFDGVALLSPPDVKGTVIAGSLFRGARMSERGSCYYPGGQAVMVANAEGNLPKLIVNNRVEDYDCIAISVYNHGPVHNINVSGNRDDGSGLWSILGPREDFSALTLVGNDFAGPVRIGHGAFMPKASGLVLSTNTFHDTVSFMISPDSPAVSDCGNDYRAIVWRQEQLPMRSRSRSSCPAFAGPTVEGR